MRLRSARRVLAVLAALCVLACFGTTAPALALDDEHGHTAVAADYDDHGHAAPAKDPHAQPAAKPITEAPKSERKEAAKSEAKTDAKTDAKTISMHGGESKPEPKLMSKVTSAASAADAPVTADAALKMLQEGNQRWVLDKDENPNTEPSRRAMVTERGQKPFCSILTCADSRLPVERIFDRGVGEIFVVRVAGNVAGTSETGTLEYANEHLKTPLFVVMGHTKCGAVAAAASGAVLHGALGELVSNIAPAVERVKRNNPEIDEKQIAPLAVKENVWQTITDLLKRSPEMRAAVSKNEIKIVGAVCDIATGKVEWMGEHPWQAELVEAFKVRASKATESTDATKHDEK